MTDRTSKNLSKFPKYGWKVKLDHKFPEARDQNLKPSLKQKLEEIRFLSSDWSNTVNNDVSQFICKSGFTINFQNYFPCICFR